MTHHLPSSKIKIVYIIGGLPFGGVENWLFDVLNVLKNDPVIKPTVINLSGTGKKIADFLENKLPLINLTSSNKSLNTHRLDTLIKLRQVLKKIQPNLIHTLHFSGDYFGRIASIGFSIPIITHIHNIKREKKIHRRLINKLLSLKTDAYIANSYAVKDTIIKDHLLVDKKIFVLYNSINFNSLDVLPLDLNKSFGIKEKNIILGVGRLVEQKNFDLLIKAFAYLKQHNINNIALVIVGDGSKRTTLKNLATKLGIKDNTYFIGYRKDVGALMLSSKVLAMPSAYEGFGNVLLEALYCQLPAVVSPFVPAIEVAKDACLISPNNHAAIAENIKKVLFDSHLRDKLIQEGQKVCSLLSFENHIRQLKQIYFQLA
jgi:glycosyltransferase involved in cell wall biosynthesis